ncbi:MAG TPA: hypothetical protein VGI64_01180, partial [Streptosporangiaceae bacterium]
MRKLLAFAAVLAAGTAALAGALPASASASVAPAAHVSAITPDTSHTNVQLCDLNTPVLCMSGFDGAGKPVKGFASSPGAKQDVDTTQTAQCNGVVQPFSACPFTNPLLDEELANSQIIIIDNHQNGLFYRYDGSGADKVIESLDGTGELWVQVGTLTGGAALVNVQASDDANTGVPQVLCTNGGGNPLVIKSAPDLTTEGTIPSFCAWQIP